MQNLSVVEKGIGYLWLALATYSEGCIYIVMYIAALIFVLLKGNKLDKGIFIPQAVVLLLTVYNPVFPVVLNRIFDVNNEYYRFFWIAPVVILVAYVLAQMVDMHFGFAKILVLLVAVILIAAGGNFLYKDGYIKSPNIYKMPTEVPEIAQMIHEDAAGRYDGDYYPRAIFEFDYEMCLRQYDASIMMTCDREAYLNAVQGRLDMETILANENLENRVLSVVVLNVYITPEQFKEGLEATGTEYVCVSTANQDLCDYLRGRCQLRVVGESENHTLYHYELQEKEGWRLPDYSDVWENY